MEQRPVTDKKSVVLVTKRAKGLLFYSRMLVTESAGPPPPPQFCHPLLTWSATNKLGDVAFLLSNLKICARGVTAVSAMALLFMAWAISATKNSYWPGRSAAYISTWAKTQPFAKVGGALGVNGFMIARKALHNGYIGPREAIATVSAPLRTLIAKVVTTPTAALLDYLPSSSSYHYVAPELWVMAKKTPPISIGVRNALVSVDLVWKSRSELVAWITAADSNIVALLSDGVIKTPHFKAIRAGPLVDTATSGTAPLIYSLSETGHILTLRRAAIAKDRITKGLFKITMAPAKDSTSTTQNTVRDGIPTHNKTTLYEAEHVCWAHIYFWACELGMPAVTLVGHTPSAIAMTGNGGYGGTWLDLLGPNIPTTIDTSRLTTLTGNPFVKGAAAAVAEEHALRKTGFLVNSDLVRIRSPAPHRPLLSVL
jgi:hypothetical protein